MGLREKGYFKKWNENRCFFTGKNAVQKIFCTAWEKISPESDRHDPEL